MPRWVSGCAEWEACACRGRLTSSPPRMAALLTAGALARTGGLARAAVMAAHGLKAVRLTSSEQILSLPPQADMLMSNKLS